MIEYQKLVRDKIPQIIRNSGSMPITRVLDDAEYLSCLENKLDEELLNSTGIITSRSLLIFWKWYTHWLKQMATAKMI